MVVKATQAKWVPKFNRGIYLENIVKVGTIDEIFGPVDAYLFSVNMEQGVKADAY
jgi:H/ACA ribonucleoprotein complex subunit 1